MSEQFFTDDKMALASAATFIAMLAVGIVLLTWRDWDVLWVGVYELIQVLFIIYYFHLWASPDSPTRLFPEVNLLARPAIFWTQLLVVTYAVVRLLLKRRLRQ